MGMSDYGLFYRSWKQKIFNYLMRLTGDGSMAVDIMQETFARHFGHYGEDNHDIPLLYRIARNLFLDEMRRVKKQRGFFEEEGEEPAIDQDRRLMIRSEYRCVLSAMASLEKDEREILSLAAGGDLSYAEIASLTGISEANVKVKVHRARIKLKRIIKEGDR
jgi:RNA polymerase sigma-70 factor (ECF subfamily)